MSYEINMPPQQGWQCPVCGRVYSPYTSMCLYCGGAEKSTVTTTATNNFANDHLKED